MDPPLTDSLDPSGTEIFRPHEAKSVDYMDPSLTILHTQLAARLAGYERTEQ